jgi:hypothetical protein
MSKKLARFGDLLGESHDLFLLEQFVEAKCVGQPKGVADFNQWIVVRQEKLSENILGLGVRLYAERPSALCTRLGGHWNAWRG